MIGIDIARIRRWVVKTYEQYSGIGYRVEVVDFTVTSLDGKGGIDATFVARVYNVSDNTSVITFNGTYNRMHYGGWEVHLTSNS